MGATVVCQTFGAARRREENKQTKRKRKEKISNLGMGITASLPEYSTA